MSEEPPIILASASPTRRDMLRRAGVVVSAEPAAIDEAELRAGLRAEAATASQAAETLARLKAAKISQRHGGALVIGADQILECEGRWFDKPRDRAEAAGQLRALAGKRHALATGVCLMRGGAHIWHHNDMAHLTMRPLSEAFVKTYLDAMGDEALGAVGAYQLEGLGAQLFSRVDGDFFAILGLPLLPLLAVLREHGAVPP